MKKIVIFAFCIIVAASLTGCGTIDTDRLYESNVGEIQCDGKLRCVSGDGICSEWIDTETGVHYFYCQLGGLTPRLNADGTVIVGE